MMSNEELAVAIQSGERELLPELWARVERFVWNRARRWYPAIQEAYDVDADDLAQSGFFALLNAVETFDADAGSGFVGWLDFHLKTAFARAMGVYTARQRMEPIRHAARLDAPFADGEENDAPPLADFIADPSSQRGYQAMETMELYEALYAAVERLPKEERDVIRARYWRGLTPAEIAGERGKTRSDIRNIERRALRKLGNPAMNGTLCRLYFNTDK